MATEKQINFINKLLNEKATNYYELQALYHAGTGKQSRLSDVVSDLESNQASWVIEQLIAAPKKLNQAQIAASAARFDKYERLIEWAKAQGVNVRKRMKRVTVMTAIKNAGLEIPQELK